MWSDCSVQHCCHSHVLHARVQITCKWVFFSTLPYSLSLREEKHWRMEGDGCSRPWWFGRILPPAAFTRATGCVTARRCARLRLPSRPEGGRVRACGACDRGMHSQRTLPHIVALHLVDGMGVGCGGVQSVRLHCLLLAHRWFPPICNHHSVLKQRVRPSVHGIRVARNLQTAARLFASLHSTFTLFPFVFSSLPSFPFFLSFSVLHIFGKCLCSHTNMRICSIRNMDCAAFFLWARSCAHARTHARTHTHHPLPPPLHRFTTCF